MYFKSMCCVFIVYCIEEIELGYSLLNIDHVETRLRPVNDIDHVEPRLRPVNDIDHVEPRLRPANDIDHVEPRQLPVNDSSYTLVSCR